MDVTPERSSRPSSTEPFPALSYSNTTYIGTDHCHAVVLGLRCGGDGRGVSWVAALRSASVSSTAFALQLAQWGRAEHQMARIAALRIDIADAQMLGEKHL